MRLCSILPVVLLLCCSLPLLAVAESRLYVGSLTVVTTSGKACAGLPAAVQPLSAVIITDEESGTIRGYFGGEAVTVGRFSGPALDRLDVRYPYPDATRAEGHTLQLQLEGAALTGELHDRHIQAGADDCNFDLARIALQRSLDQAAAHTVEQRLARNFDALQARYTAQERSRAGDYAEALLLYQQAFALARQDLPADSARLSPYLAGLAGCYIRLGRFTDFNRLYDEQAAHLQDRAVQQMFRFYRIQLLLQSGRDEMGREEYPAALKQFRQVIELDYKNKNAISAIMSALVRSGQYDEALTFLESTEQKLDNEADRRDVRGATALVQYHKAKKEHKAGRLKEAETALRSAVRLDPEAAYYLILLARWRHQAGNYAEADGILASAQARFRDEAVRQELNSAREKLRQTEQILNGIRRAGA